MSLKIKIGKDLEFRIGEKKIRLNIDKNGYPLTIEAKGIKKEDKEKEILGRIACGLPTMKEFDPTKENIKLITMAYLTTSIVAYKIGWKFEDVLRYAFIKTEKKPLLDYLPGESSHSYFKRIMIYLGSEDRINEVTSHAIECYDIFSKKN